MMLSNTPAPRADATCSVRALVAQLGRLCNRNQVAVTLYAAAARHDAIDFDPDAFGDFSA